MKSIILFLLFFTIILGCKAQVSLIPNPDFEEYTSCPGLSTPSTLDTSESIFPAVKYWFASSIQHPVHYNRCATYSSFLVPKNVQGFQETRSGNVYLVMIAVWQQHGDSQLISNPNVKLIRSLYKDSIYKVSYFVSLAERRPVTPLDSYARYTNCLATSSMGAYFSKTKVYYPTKSNLPVVPQVQNNPTRFLDDTAGWMEVSGLYRAAGGEQYLTLGNFKSKQDTKFKIVRYGTHDTTQGYGNYYLDDVSLIPVGYAQNTRTDTTMCIGSRWRVAKRSGYDSCLWNDGDTSQQKQLAQTGIYWVTGYSGNVHVTDTFVLTIKPLPVITSLTDTTVCFDEVAQILLDAGHFSSYLWKPTGETTQTIYSNKAQVYLLTVTDSNNCGTTKQVAVMETCPDFIYIPTAFTPNNDGVNDVFLPKTQSLQTYELSIINRWGAIVFTTQNPQLGWDGKDAPAGVYIAQIRYSAAGKSMKIVSQNVTLLR